MEERMQALEKKISKQEEIIDNLKTLVFVHIVAADCRYNKGDEMCDYDKDFCATCAEEHCPILECAYLL